MKMMDLLNIDAKREEIDCEMKQLSVVTWMGGGNFGTSLQSYALCAFFENKGYKVNILTDRPLRFIRGCVRRVSHLTGVSALLQRMRYKGDKLKGEKLRRFHRKYYHRPAYFTAWGFSKVVAQTDVFVTGSDQIWNTHYFFNPFFFLDFCGNKKRVAYASSIGTKDVKEEYRDEVKTLLSRFAHIGVREESAVTALKRLLPEKEILQVLDPTFLLTAGEWEAFSRPAIIEIDVPQEYILCYLIGNRPEYARQLAEVQSHYGIKNVIVIPSVENPDQEMPGTVVYPSAGPLEFVKLLLGATLVCTDSFHATAVSINANKDFVEFMRFSDADVNSQNARIYDVLAHYGLSDRIFSAEKDEWTSAIDYAKVNPILEADRKSSVSYLLNAIEN